jgi:thiol-disulfide isomerase/thioredoxin
MYMKTFKTLLFLPVILFSFCSSKPEASTDKGADGGNAKGQVFKIHGRITGYTGTQLILNEFTTAGQVVPIDTADIDQAGSFAFEGFLREKSLGYINLGQYRNVFLIIDTATDMGLTINNTGVVTYDVTNSPESDELQKIARINADYNQRIIDLDAAFQQNPTMGASGRQEVDNKINGLISELKEKMVQATIICSSPLAQIFSIEMLQVSLPLAEEQKLIEKVKTLPANQWHTMYVNKAQSRLQTAVGAVAPDINLNTPDGKPLSLSSLKGKYVLIDFWASWCKPCRAENPNVVRMYAEYKAKGFEIFGVSLDQQSDAWKGAIVADGLTWLHVSDLKGWQSSAAKLYSVNSIPQTILLDKEGKIIAKGLRGAELENKLKTLLN